MKMKRKAIVVLGLTLLALLSGVWGWRGSMKKNIRDEHPSNGAINSKSSGALSAVGTDGRGAISMPRLFKATRYPPETAEEKAMWDWWHAMEKSDPKFEWKMPIDFYGRVVDQFGKPVADAVVDFAWNIVGGTQKKNSITDANGCFSLLGEHGKVFQAEVSKDGYLPTSDSKRSFEYAAFFHENFHVPDQTQPVIFRLRKLMGAEPMVKHVTNAEFALSANPVVLNVETGKLGVDGDLTFSVEVGSTRGQYGLDFTLAIRAHEGVSLAFGGPEEEFMFNAPESGYRQEVLFRKLSSDANNSRVQSYRLYVRTRSGKYAAITGEISIREGLSAGKAGFHAIVYYNPSGSRNLEFDHRKWINR